MTVDRTVVRIGIEGENVAASKVRALQADMDRLTQKAQTAEGAATRAQRLESLLQSAKSKGFIKRGGFEYGAVEFGAGGFELNKGWLRGGGGGAGLAFAAVTMTRALVSGVTRMANTASDAYQFYREHEDLSAYELAKRAASVAGEKVIDTFGVRGLSESLWRSLGAWQGRVRTTELATAASNEVWQNAFGYGRTDLDVALDQQRAAMAETRRKLREMEEAEQSARAEFIAKSDAEIAKRAAGVKAVRPPVRLTRQMAQVYKDLEARGQERLKEKMRGARDAALAQNEGH